MKKHHLLMFLTAFSATLSCTSIQGSKNNSKTTTQLTSFTKRFSGTIDNKTICMELINNNDTIHGSYYYKTIGQKLTLKGQLSNDNKIIINEFNNNNILTGTFEGSIISDSLFTGFWTNSKKSKQLPFNLKEEKNNFIKIKTNVLAKEDCLKEELRKNMTPEELEVGLHCTSLDISYFEATHDSYNSVNSINRIIKSKFLKFDSNHSTIEEMFNIYKYEDNNAGNNISIGYEIVLNDNNILSFYTYISEANLSDAHPNSSSQSTNINILTGKEITLNDLLIPNYHSELNKIGEKHFINDYGHEDWDFTLGEFKLKDEFLITTTGLLFRYDHYEIGPYAMGSPDVFITYKEIKHLIKPNGLIAYWLTN